jgi:hypothetical protein
MPCSVSEDYSRVIYTPIHMFPTRPHPHSLRCGCLTPPMSPLCAQGDYDNRTALHLAASTGKLECVMALMAAKASVDIEDRWGNTPLQVWCRRVSVPLYGLLCGRVEPLASLHNGSVYRAHATHHSW